MSRRRSVSSQENDERLLDAALEEIAARRGRPARHERGRPPRRAHDRRALRPLRERLRARGGGVDDAVSATPTSRSSTAPCGALVDDDRSIPLGEVIDRAGVPVALPPSPRSSSSRRPAASTSSTKWSRPRSRNGCRAGGAGPRVRDRRRRAQVLFTARFGVGCAPAHDSPPPRDRMGTGDRGRPPVVRSALRGPDRTLPTRGGRHGSGRDGRRGPERAHRFRLGHHRTRRLRARHDLADRPRAPASRRARSTRATKPRTSCSRTRSRFCSPGAWPTISKRTAPRTPPPMSGWRPRASSAGTSARRGANGGRSGSRRSSRRGTVRSWPPTLDQVQEAAIYAYLEALGARTAEEHRALDAFGRFAQLIPLGLAFVDLVTPGVAGTDWRRGLRSPPRASRLNERAAFRPNPRKRSWVRALCFGPGDG